jgi:hypothetical protein
VKSLTRSRKLNEASWMKARSSAARLSYRIASGAAGLMLCGCSGGMLDPQRPIAAAEKNHPHQTGA